MMFKSAVKAWTYLNGIVCLYKSSPETMNHIRQVALLKLCQDLNSLKCRDVRKFIEIDGETTKAMTVRVKQNYADHPLAVGPRYMPDDFRTKFVNRLGMRTSGVCVLGINDGRHFAREYEEALPLKVYHIKGRLGISTDTFFVDGKTTFRCNYDYLAIDDINRVVAAVQAYHQKNLFHLTGVNLQSQKACELAASGLIRPRLNNAPVIYDIKCIDFSSPYFTLEVTCVNEDEYYLLGIILDIGNQLKNVASTVSIRCIRVGFFSVELALLKKHFNVNNITENMRRCYEIIENSKQLDLELQKFEKEPTSFPEEDTRDLDVEEIDEELKEFDPELKAY